MTIVDEVMPQFTIRRLRADGWAVSRTGDGALLLERDGKAYRVEVRKEQ